MMRRTEFFECEDGNELAEVISYANERTDGGRTHITLSRRNSYYLNEPLHFRGDSRVTMDFDGMCVTPFGEGVKITKLT